MVLYIKHMLVAYVILNIVSNALCIKCWSCRSSNDPKCADPFDNSTVPITDCKQEKGLRHLPGVRPSMCRKIRQKVVKSPKSEYVYDFCLSCVILATNFFVIKCQVGAGILVSRIVVSGATKEELDIIDRRIM
ncbi:unnamed protein product [Colias eurytheme]|nr:unnamed protein product [Colias eurytheme]